jgi:hypothetical protein
MLVWNLPRVLSGVVDPYAYTFPADFWDLHFTPLFFKNSHVSLSMILQLDPESIIKFLMLTPPTLMSINPIFIHFSFGRFSHIPTIGCQKSAASSGSPRR